VELQRVSDVADGDVRAVAGKLRELRGRCGRPLAGPQVDLQRRRVVRKVVNVGSAPVPNRLEDAVRHGRALADAVDEHLPGGRAPLVCGVAAVAAEVRTIQLLQRCDVVHHQRLREAAGLVRVARCRGGPDIRAVAHDRVLHRVAVGGHGAERALNLVRVLQAKGVPDLVDEREVGVVALQRLAVGAARLVEPGVAALRRGAREIGPRGAWVVGRCEAQGGVAGRGLGNLAEREVHDRAVHLQRSARGGLLRGVQDPEVVLGLPVAVGRAVVGSARREAEGQAADRPLLAPEQAVDVWVSGRGNGRDSWHQRLRMPRGLCRSSSGIVARSMPPAR
jgi:hypothetical protein